MKIKTSELIGAALDWAVALLESEASPTGMNSAEILLYRSRATNAFSYKQYAIPYSTDWAHGGPIIEREKLTIEFVPECYWHFPTPTDTWTANYGGGGEWIGPTPLIAAMRCYVASKLGDTIDIPEELQ